MDIHPSISVKDQQTGQKKIYKMEQESIVIGRDRSNFIVLPSKGVSRSHAEIRFENGCFFVVDLESGNGTYVNSQRLSPKEKMLLRSNDKIRIEDFDIVFRSNGEKQPDFGEITDTDILEIKMIKKLLRAVDKENAPVLEVVSGDEKGKRFVFDGKHQEIVIGRDPACEFQIESEVISRKHARVIKKWDTVTIIDLASKNGVYVNDTRINEQVLSDGDRILLGTLPLLYRNPTEHGWDYLAAEPPPKTEPEKEEAPPPPKDLHEEPSVVGRVARRSDGKGTVEKEVKAPEKAPPPEPEPEQPPPAEVPQQPPPEPAPAAETGPEAEKATPLLQRFSPMEIIAAAVGLIILLLSIWFLMKLL